MPRQDVPYGGAICRLRERIAEIWDKLGEKLHSVNGVEGDAAGNVEIVSGDAAITISESQVGHYIEIGLDHSELPSAAVQSVNGRTGDVILHSSDIGADGGVSVQGAIDNLSTRVTTNGSAITQEVIDRQNADAALQGNINTVQASIPGAAATAVANDPTVAQLATDVPNKLDKITSGSTLKAYTHTGATQGETSVVDGTAANSIGIRDANGRMQAADPASGATDKTLVTANWVSQTGDSAPNNVIHKTGNETKRGYLMLPNGSDGIILQHAVNTDNIADDKWRLAFTLTMNPNEILIIRVISAFNNADTQDALVKIVRGSGRVIRCQVIGSSGTTAQMASAANYVATLDGSTVSFYTYKRRRYTNLYCITLFYGEYGYVKPLPTITYSNTASNDPSTETHDAIGVGAIVPYHNQA